MRPIDADELRGRIIAFSTGCNTTYLTVANIVMMINKADTVDAVPAVRCRDCEHLVNATVNANGFLICGVSDMEVAPEDFCSHGERKVDENGRN